MVILVCLAVVAVAAFALGGRESRAPSPAAAPAPRSIPVRAPSIPPRDPITQWRTDRDFSGAEYLTVGGGCFWCVEAVFDLVPGVIDAVSGYAGGTFPDPTYQAVLTGLTGHAEVVQIAFDPAVTSVEALLDVFWRAHDPTTPNRQGYDVGPMYRSIILYRDTAQERIARASLAAAERSQLYRDRIVTEVVPLEVFYPAEGYHQDYFAKNPLQAYCQLVIAPKLEELEAKGVIGL